jgi:uncharacterized protein YjiS (DUF1127 family)
MGAQSGAVAPAVQPGTLSQKFHDRRRNSTLDPTVPSTTAIHNSPQASSAYFVKAVHAGDEGDKTMSTFDYSQSHRRRSIGVAAATIVAQVTGALQAIGNWHEARLAARRLHSLSDSHLKDIGMHRGQIEFVVRGLDVAWTRRGYVEH